MLFSLVFIALACGRNSVLALPVAGETSLASRQDTVDPNPIFASHAWENRYVSWGNPDMCVMFDDSFYDVQEKTDGYVAPTLLMTSIIDSIIIQTIGDTLEETNKKGLSELIFAKVAWEDDSKRKRDETVDEAGKTLGERIFAKVAWEGDARRRADIFAKTAWEDARKRRDIFAETAWEDVERKRRDIFAETAWEDARKRDDSGGDPIFAVTAWDVEK
ncbi:hypothetical protein VNI00_008915 [Paramarasmius palmivorus]|uniref:Uncharacterized protein n=1 Tax=Paramarasmius palmivorus TaxID=297713 RepID=A0AAW0CSJ2_9AGAR